MQKEEKIQKLKTVLNAGLHKIDPGLTLEKFDSITDDQCVFLVSLLAQVSKSKECKAFLEEQRKKWPMRKQERD